MSRARRLLAEYRDIAGRLAEARLLLLLALEGVDVSGLEQPIVAPQVKRRGHRLVRRRVVAPETIAVAPDPPERDTGSGGSQSAVA